jgi:hypothetical protein
VVITSLTERGDDIARQADEHSRAVMTQIAEMIGDDAEVERVRAAMKRIDEAFAAKA